MKNVQGIDLVLVDEASQCLEAELSTPVTSVSIIFLLDNGVFDIVLVFSCRPSNLILVGDPSQLPATVLSQELKATGGHVSTMERLIRSCHMEYDLLDTQYRMHPEIARFCNVHFYKGSIKNGDVVSTRPYILPLSTSLPCWLRPYSFINFTGKEIRQRAKISNPREAQFLAQVVRYLIKKLGIGSDRISVITFYSAQVSCLIGCLARLGVAVTGSASVKVATVDSFQGSESDVVLLSMVRCNGPTVGFLKDFQRLNVSLTRAKYLHINIGDALTLSNSGVPSLCSLVSDAKGRDSLYDFSSVELLS